MPAQDTLTMSQVRTILGDGKAEIVTHDAVIQPGRHSFASQDELNAYLVEVFGAKTQRSGIGGSLSCKGKYVRRTADGTPAVTFGSGASRPYAVTVGDFNNDGHADLAVANLNSGTVGVLLGDGVGPAGET